MAGGVARVWSGSGAERMVVLRGDPGPDEVRVRLRLELK